MVDRKAAIRQHMQELHEETWAFLTSLRQEDLAEEVYSGDEVTWTVGDLVAHLADAERGLLGQAQRLAAGGQTVPEGFDLNRWNRSAVRKRAAQPLQSQLHEIMEAYQDALEFLDSVPEDKLDLEGRRGGGELTSLEGYFYRMLDHRAEHVADMRRALGE